MKGSIRLMRYVAICMVLILCGCCRPPSGFSPPFPGRVEVWQSKRGPYLLEIGRFVLFENESSNNGAIGVTVKKVAMPNCKGMFDEPPRPTVVLQLYDPSTKRLLCEQSFYGLGPSLFASECIHDPQYAVTIEAINTKDHWVSFELQSDLP